MTNMMEKLDPIFKLTENTLTEWNESSHLTVPQLVKTMALKMNWSEKEIRLNDNIIRLYLSHHDTWEIRRGAKGGIFRKVDQQKLQAAKQAKDIAKAQIQAQITAKLNKI